MSKFTVTASLLVLFAFGTSMAIVLTPSASAGKRLCPGNSCASKTTTTPATSTETTTTTTATPTTTPATSTGATTTTPATPTTSPTLTTTTSTTAGNGTGAASSIYWGAYIDGDDTYSYLYGGTWGDAPWDANTWTKFDSNAGKAPSIVHWGLGTPWARDFSYWQGTFDLVQKRGALSLADMSTGSVPLRDIANGQYDSALRTWAQQAKAWGHPFFLRPDWEMNGSWFSWGTTSGNQNTPATYVDAWRHMRSIFDSAGANNVTWVWCPNLSYSGTVPYSQLYPGDAYVDWTCLDGYNKGSISTSFASLYSASYAELVKVAPTKPIMIGEIASIEYGSGVKAAWTTDALSTQLPTNFPQVKALVWFNWRIYDGSWTNCEIESSASSQAAFAAAIGSPYYEAAGALGNLPLLTKISPL